MKKLSIIDKFIYFINTLLALALLVSYLLPYISPEKFPFLAILSLFVPALILINSLFVFYWLIKLKKQLLLSTLILAIGWSFNSSLIQFSGKELSNKKGLSIMSYNVRMFNRWKWIDNDSIGKNIINFVKSKDADIVLFQEYYILEKEKLDYEYKYIKTQKKDNKTGLAIYSKYPIINKGSLNLENTSNNIIFIDIVKEKDTVRIYNFHLQSLQLNTNEENFGQENSEKLIARLKESFKIQAEQTKVFLEHEKAWKGKKIVAGDFNNTNYSWIYNQIANDKKDTFLEAGKGFGKTFNYWFPLRIDFILTDKKTSVNSYQSFQKQQNSDHFPILTNISF